MTRLRVTAPAVFVLVVAASLGAQECQSTGEHDGEHRQRDQHLDQGQAAFA